MKSKYVKTCLFSALSSQNKLQNCGNVGESNCVWKTKDPGRRL